MWPMMWDCDVEIGGVEVDVDWPWQDDVLGSSAHHARSAS